MADRLADGQGPCRPPPRAATSGFVLGRALQVSPWLALWTLGCGDPLDRVLQREGDAEAGAIVFAERCAQCHGTDGSGGTGPNLRDDDDTTEELADKILWGWGAMEGFEGDLSVREIADVVAFLETLQEGR